MSGRLYLSGSEKRKKHAAKIAELSILPKLTAFFTPLSPVEESNPAILENATSATSTAEAIEDLLMSSNDQTGDDNCGDSKCDGSNLDCTNAEDVQSEDAILAQDFTILSDPALWTVDETSLERLIRKPISQNIVNFPVPKKLENCRSAICRQVCLSTD